MNGLQIERAWVIECYRCANTAEADGTCTEVEARGQFDDQGWTREGLDQFCPQCNGVKR